MEATLHSHVLMVVACSGALCSNKLLIPCLIGIPAWQGVNRVSR
ncbi:hypothetical protein [Kushneria indalinina]|nr:hypothetical protein [Kushneria indalinina]